MCPMISDGLIDHDKNTEDSKESGKTLRYIHQCTAPRRRRMWRMWTVDVKCVWRKLCVNQLIVVV